MQIYNSFLKNERIRIYYKHRLIATRIYLDLEIGSFKDSTEFVNTNECLQLILSLNRLLN